MNCIFIEIKNKSEILLQRRELKTFPLLYILDHNIYTSMPSSNQRSSSARPSRKIENNVRLQTVRSTSATNRPFTIVLTDNSELLRHTDAIQFPVNYNNFFSQITHQRQTINPVQYGANNNNDNNLEHLLNNLLGLELRDEARDYLSRTS
jgi:hypothetical protein